MAHTTLRWISIIALLLLGLGIAGWYGPSRLIAANATADWPTTQGEVVRCELLAPAKSGQDWKLGLFYRFEVDGAVFRSNRWDVHGARRFGTRAEAEAAEALHEVGDAVQVRYDPRDPSQAVLASGGTRDAWLIITLGAGIAILATRQAARRVFRRR